MDSRALTCPLEVGEAPRSLGRSYREPAMDDDGHRLRKVVHCFHWDAPERQARIPFSRTQQNRPGPDLSCVVLIHSGRIPRDLLVYAESGLQALNAGGPESSASPLTRSVVYDRLHHLLRHLLSLIPTLPSTLHPLLVRNFPHKRQSQTTQVTYIRNLLRATEYCSELADRILALIIDRALQIDVCTTSISTYVTLLSSPSGRDPSRVGRTRTRRLLGERRLV